MSLFLSCWESSEKRTRRSAWREYGAVTTSLSTKLCLSNSTFSHVLCSGVIRACFESETRFGVRWFGQRRAVLCTILRPIESRQAAAAQQERPCIERQPGADCNSDVFNPECSKEKYTNHPKPTEEKKWTTLIMQIYGGKVMKKVQPLKAENVSEGFEPISKVEAGLPSSNHSNKREWRGPRGNKGPGNIQSR
eukprot:scaffold2778_cov168-Amphora_coffeaeformis.AAC.9